MTTRTPIIFTVLLIAGGLLAVGIFWRRSAPTPQAVMAQPTPTPSTTPIPDEEDKFIQLVGKQTTLSWSPSELTTQIERNQQLREQNSQAPLLDLTSFWRDLQMSVGLEDGVLWDVVQTQRVNLVESPAHEWLVVLTSRSSLLRRYLAFQQVTPTAWRFLGAVEYTFPNAHFFSTHKVVRIGKNPYLLLRALTGSGTGFSRTEVHLYDFEPGNFRSVLHYVSAEIEAGGPALTREIKSAPLLPLGPAQECQVRFTRLVAAAPIYPHCETTGLLNFTGSRAVHFSWSQEQNRFVINVKKSGLTEEQFQEAYQDTSYEAVLRSHFAVLLRAAQSKSSNQRACVREFVEHCEDSPQRQQLLNALAP